MPGGGCVGSQNRCAPAWALLHQPVPQPAKQGSGPRQWQPLTVGWIGDNQPPAPLRPHLLEVLHFQDKALGHSGCRSTGPGRFNRSGVEIAGGKTADWHPHPRLEFGQKPLSQGPIAIAKFEKSMRPAPGPPQAGGHAGGDRGRLNHKSAGTTERIEQRLARLPAGDIQNPGGEHFREWCLHLSHAPAALVERSASRIAKDGCGVADQMERQPQRGAAELHARPPATGGAQLIDHRILDDLSGVEGVGEKTIMDRRIDPQRVGNFELLSPVDLLHRRVERVGGIDDESSQRLEHADRRPALQHGAVEHLPISSGIARSGKFNRAPTDAQVAGSHPLQFPRQHPLQPLERARREARGLLRLRRSQRSRHGRNGGETGGRHQTCNRIRGVSIAPTVAGAESRRGEKLAAIRGFHSPAVRRSSPAPPPLPRPAPSGGPRSAS